MNKEWRPKNWSNPYHKSRDFGEGLICWNEYPEFEIFEAGADAMLKALKDIALVVAPYGVFPKDLERNRCQSK